MYGNENDAKELLSFIDKQLSDKLALPKNIFEKVLSQYNFNKIYQNVIDTMINIIKENIKGVLWHIRYYIVNIVQQVLMK